MAMTPLGTLIKECQALFLDQHGVELSYGDIARRSQGLLTRTRVQQLATGPIKSMPGPDRIRGLALGLGVPESVVTERALISAGYQAPTGWSPPTTARPVGKPSRSLSQEERSEAVRQALREAGAPPAEGADDAVDPACR